MVLHIVNLSSSPQDIHIDFTSFGKIRKAEKWAISGDENDANSPDDPERISARRQEVDYIDGKCHLQPYSYTLIDVKR